MAEGTARETSERKKPHGWPCLMSGACTHPLFGATFAQNSTDTRQDEQPIRI